MRFYTYHLASWLRARRFSEPTFRPSEAAHAALIRSGKKKYYESSRKRCKKSH
jgi:hypothetical protein